MVAVEGYGRTVEEAVVDALARSGLKRSEVNIKVVSEGKAKLLGLIGGEDAVVEIESKVASVSGIDDEIVSFCQEMVTTIIEKSGIDVDVNVSEEDGALKVDLSGVDSALVIGRYGDTLVAFQTIFKSILFRKFMRKTLLLVDSESYVKRQDERLSEFAIKMAKEVERYGKPIELEPMNARERRIVHMALSNFSGISTESTGDGEDRRVVISENAGREGLVESGYNRS